ncbi:hypothetical protein M8J76_008823 [Diaphorina citri]|nr:hypothetical protein M8J76_008823 [Diaphorina citri]
MVLKIGKSCYPQKQKARPTSVSSTLCLAKATPNDKKPNSLQTTSQRLEESQNEISTDPVQEARKSECDKDMSEEDRPKKDEVSEDEEESKEFLKFLELEPPESKTFKRGRTACTITKKLSKPPNHPNFGFSICWMNPPRIDGIKPGYPAESCGLKCGDYIIFVEKTNVTMKGQEEVLRLFEEYGNSCSLEIYRPCKDDTKKKKKKKRPAPMRSISTPLPAACEVANESQARTSVSMDISKKALDLPDIPPIFEGFVGEQGRLEGINQLVNTEKSYIACLQFGIARFLLPLAERKDLCSPKEHVVLFQNSQELLRISEDILEKLNSNLPDSDKPFAYNIGEIYYNKLAVTGSSYRKYCCGLKKSFCILAEKTRNKSFMTMLNEPPIPKKRPDLIGFLHKPLEHFRLVLKLLQGILNCTAQDSKDYQYLLQVVNQYQTTYKEITVESGLMEPKGEGKPLLTLQDLESRLVFTRCKPFALESSGRSWIFGGDLTRIEGNVAKRYWALLFTDIIVFAKVSRDRVIFITEEPLPLLQVVHAVYNIRRKETDFRLVLSDKPRDVDSPVASSCANLSLPIFPNVLRKTKVPKFYKRQLIRLRAPTIELKAVWQNLINRQVIYLNTGRGTTPIGTPDSQDLYVDWESNHQRLYSPEPRASIVGSTTKKASEIIEYKCNKLAKMGYKENAIHLSKWLKGEIGSSGTPTPGSELEFDIWSEDALKKRTSEIKTEHEHIFYTDRARNISRCEVVFLSANPTPVHEDHTPHKVEAVVELHEKPKYKTPHRFEDEFTDIQKSICQNCQERGHSSCHKGRNLSHNVDHIASSSDTISVFPSNSENNCLVPQFSIVPPTPPVRGRTLSQTSMDQVDREIGNDENNLIMVSKENDALSNQNLNYEDSLNDLPYLPLNAKSKLKKFNTRLSLEKLSDTEEDEEFYYESEEDCQQNVADDNDDDAEYSDDEDQMSNGIPDQQRPLCMNPRCLKQ